MTNKSINEAVARKLGADYILHTEEVPDYCTDIRAAWEIPTKIPFADDDKIKDGLAFQLMRRTENEMVSEVKIWEAGWARYDECLMVSAYADTAPMAICLAFLKLT